MTYTRESAQELAMAALVYLAERPDLIGEFLGATGLQPQDLRKAASSPDMAVHVLDYLLEDDRRVMDAAAELGVSPGDLMHARTALAGPGSYGWQI
ncbi:DUF3572 domain-containing protein [Paracoccus sp. SSK6]|uniref:DUF3572 domain-containing protein n=1 Tax=Paracoccus sp. SSK6 TaxID=3143131 RepID=UPI00321B70D6